MTAFSAGVDDLFTDPHRSVVGTYTPAGGASVSARCIVRRVDIEQPLGLTGARHPGWQVRLRRTEVAVKPKPKDTVIITAAGPWARTYTAQDVSEDEMALTWILDCRG